jgi:hypothetical protein
MLMQLHDFRSSDRSELISAGLRGLNVNDCSEAADGPKAEVAVLCLTQSIFYVHVFRDSPL